MIIQIDTVGIEHGTLKTLRQLARQTDCFRHAMIEIHLSYHHGKGCGYYVLFASRTMFFLKAVLPARQGGSHSVLLTTMCVPFSQYPSLVLPISTRFPLLHHNICLYLCECRCVGIMFENGRGSFSHYSNSIETDGSGGRQ